MPKTKTGKAREQAVKTAKRWNNTEILYAFTGWLSTRELPLIFSKRHNNVPIAKIVGEFCLANGLPNVREDYPIVQVPENTDHFTNVPPPAGQVAREKSLDEITNEVYGLLNQLHGADQNEAVAVILSKMKKDRAVRLEALKKELVAKDELYQTTRNTFEGFANVLNGGFDKLGFRL